MSNLGDYQRIVTLIKNLGGPDAAKNYAVAAAGGIFVAGGLAFAVGQKGVGAVRSRLANRSGPCAITGQTFTIHTDGEDDNGLKLHAGGQYLVLECDADAILIDVPDDADNPYVVSGKFLASISDFPTERTSEDK